jgi:hypothetical protein
MATGKNVATLSPAERAAYAGAVRALKAAPSRFTPRTAGRYDDYVIQMQAMLVLRINDATRRVVNGNRSIESDMRMRMWAHR